MPAKKANTKPTATGYALSAQNARKHELSARSINLTGDEQNELTEILSGLETAYKPLGPIETHLCQELAMSMLRQRRLWAYQALLEDKAALKAEQQAIEPAYPDGQLTFGLFGDAPTIPDEINFLSEYRTNLTRDRAETLAQKYSKFVDRPENGGPMVQFAALISSYARKGVRTQDEAMQAIEQRIQHLLQITQRLQEIQQQKPEIDRAIVIAEVPLSESIEKYQIRINRQLKLAIDQLTKLQEHRILMQQAS